MATGMRMASTDIVMTTEGKPELPDMQSLMRLQSWLSPAFPIGGYSYSHGLEYALEAGLIGDADGVVDWLAADLEFGSGRTDAMLLLAVARASSDAGLLEVAELAAALRGTAELALESTQQGQAFLTSVGRVWPNAELARLAALLRNTGIAVALPVAVGLVCRSHGIAAVAALPLYLQAWVANLVHAAVRLIPLGQTQGLTIQAALEDTVLRTAKEAALADPQDLGSAALTVDWASLQHETQMTRLFRS